MPRSFTTKHGNQEGKLSKVSFNFPTGLATRQVFIEKKPRHFCFHSGKINIDRCSKAKFTRSSINASFAGRGSYVI